MNNLISSFSKRLHVLRLFGLVYLPAWSLVLSSIQRRRFMDLNLTGKRFSVLEAEYDTFKEIFIDGEYTECLRQSGSKCPNFILDLGGNVGFSVIYFRNLWAEVDIDVFEPIPATFVRLCENVDSLHKVRLHKLSAGCVNEETLFVSNGPGSRSIVPTSADEREYVKCDQVDVFEFLKKEQYQKGGLLKMDIEGGEWNIFEDTRIDELVQRFDTIIVEVHEFNSYLVSDFESKHIARLCNHGWEFRKVREMPQWATVYVLWRSLS